MIRYVRADDLPRFPRLAETMFRDRAIQFRHRLGWDVSIDDLGAERDAYDAQNPIYAIWQRPDGSHGGSMRILPTTGRTMINDHFLHLNGGVRISDPQVWECTRFCLSPSAMRRPREAALIPAALMLAGCELGLRFGLARAVGVFDARMIRIYRSLGWSPEILGREGSGPASVAVGLWPIDRRSRAAISARSGLPECLAAEWFGLSFPQLSAASIAAE
ncbi:autoinducer synthase [Paroceanicella profunda]|uniref:Acyl-homoserine-lactone synthase n=1 Tax=Paroceanicella profunda TaxID=2579971 RepID=A0A5B8FGA3_9RHOB|nr:acyl-homoserine-lactone synthase [Paroceanicella profunda]QDL90941.1 autoinducer synthase [Paroceanicella profunda]